MTLVKLWRSITNKKYKKDTYDDINGYNELNRNLKMEENNGKWNNYTNDTFNDETIEFH